MEGRSDNINQINNDSNSQVRNINEINEENEYQKMSAYFQKISEYRENNYKKCLSKQTFCDCRIYGEWVVCYIIDIYESSILVYNMNEYYQNEDHMKITVDFTDGVGYYRKYTKPSPNNNLPQREKKDQLIKRIQSLLDPKRKNFFKNDKIEDTTKIYEDYYFLHSFIYNSIDCAIARYKDKSSGVEEGFRIIIIVLDFLSEFYQYIKDNFEEFLNYKNNLENSELADIVLFNKKYAIFSFWDDANLLMNKIFINNVNYIDWFIESEKVLQKIIPSSPNWKKITSNEKLICPLYESQISLIKKSNYNFQSRNGQLLTLKNICIENAYKNKVMENHRYRNTYILAYLIDYFYSLGGYNSLFLLCKENNNVKIATSIFDNILYGSSLTRNFGGVYETERNGVNNLIFKFLNSITLETLKTYSKNEIIDFLKKGSNLFPDANNKSSFIFEELYIRFLLKILILAKKSKEKIECLNDLINILISIEYNQLFNENNYNKSESDNIDAKKIDDLINNPKYQIRDKLIKEMNYINFCLNLKDNKIIELLFKNDIKDKILIIFAPILFVMYKNNFGYMDSDSNVEKIKETKKLVFDTILNRLKESEKENSDILSNYTQILCDFCEVLTDEDKFFFYSEIKLFFITPFLIRI